MRAFFAIVLPLVIQEQVKKLMQVLQFAMKDNSIRWTLPKNLHITLQFQKNIKIEDVTTLTHLVQKELHLISSFKLELTELEFFPSIKQPRFISLRPQPHAALAYLSQQIGKGILAAHYPIEQRPFRGHLTLGKFAQPPIQMNWDNTALPTVDACQINEVIFYASSPTSEGSNYAQLARLPLSH